METSPDTQLNERVKRGAALLDLKVPGWRHMIDDQRLNMSSTEDCILGQLFDQYIRGIDFLGLDEAYGEDRDHGFDLTYSEYEIRDQAERIEARNKLDAAWLQEIV